MLPPRVNDKDLLLDQLKTFQSRSHTRAAGQKNRVSLWGCTVALWRSTSASQQQGPGFDSWLHMFSLCLLKFPAAANKELIHIPLGLK